MMPRDQKHANRLKRLREQVTKLEKNIRQVNGFLLYSEMNGNVPWNDIVRQIQGNREEKENQEKDARFLEAVKTALVHLENKNRLILSNGSPAFSSAAMVIDSYSGTPVVGGLFSSFANNYKNAGIRKQENRLEQLSEWIEELKEKYSVSLSRQIRRLIR